MSKIFTHNFLSRLLALLLVCLAGWSQKAAAEGTGTMDDPFVLVNGGEYQETSSKYFHAKFVVPADVADDDVFLVIDNLRTMMLYVYADAGYSQEISEDLLTFTGSNPWMMKLAVKKGTKAGTAYYFRTFSMQSNTLSVEYGVGVGQPKSAELESVIPADGSTLSAALCNVSFCFTQDITFDGAELQVGSVTKYPQANGQGRYVSVEPKAELMELYESEQLKAGDDIRITLKNVRAASGANTLGNVSVAYKAAGKPVMIVQTVNTPGNGLDEFLSYMPLAFEKGVVEVGFDGDLLTSNPDLSAALTYGDLESEGDFYREPLEVQFVGTRRIAIDLRGKLRTPQTMGIASGTAYPTMSLSITGLKDATGNFVFSEQSGGVGMCGFDYDYRLVRYNFDKEFTPGSGSSIDRAESIELYLRESGDGKLTYDGACFEYTDGGSVKTLTVGRDLFDIQPDPEDETAQLIYIPVPDFSRDANSEVVLSLTGLQTPDGLDHSADFCVRYTTAGHAAAVVLAVESATMTTSDGKTVIDLLRQSEQEKLIADATLTIATNRDAEIGLMRYSVNDVTTGEVVKSFYDTTQKNAAGHWEFWLPMDYVLQAGHNYEILLEGWSSAEAYYSSQPSLGTVAVSLRGATKSFEYSDIVLVSPASLHYAEGEADFSLADASQSVIDFTFSGSVEVAEAFVPLGFGETEPCSVTMSNENRTASLRIPSSVLTAYSQFVVSLLVKDSQGRVVKGNNGEGDASYISAYVDAKFNLPVPQLVSPAEGTTVSEVSRLRFHYAQGIQPSWSAAAIQVCNAKQEVVAVSANVVSLIPEDEQDNWEYVVTDVEVVLNVPVMQTGSYTIVVPEGFFSMDLKNQGFGMKSNRACSFSVEVEGADVPITEELNCDILPAEGKVTALYDFNITFNDYNVVSWTQEAYPIFTDASGKETEVTDLQWGDDFWLANQLKCVLPEIVNADGVYKLTIPVGAVTYDDNPYNVNSIPAVFEYIIGSGNSIARLLGSDSASAYDVYTPSGQLVRRRASAAALQTLPAGTYVINGRTVIVR